MGAKETVQHEVFRPKVNISFRDLNYSALCGKQAKCIIKTISGSFKGGQMTAILGPSGSGKTSLINILAGYKITDKVSGLVFMNNQKRVLKDFYKVSRYIMQENSLQPYLTVLDSMMIAADFKLDDRVTKQEKQQMVTNILKTLLLSKVKNNTTEKLSGGERKRLAIGLELINNPSVLFLDEPTSGLDEQASYKCLTTLKNLAEEGRTVICSIHAPSTKAFALFDHVYVMTDGQCTYQGQGQQIVPFLETIQLTCPIHYNPIDYFIDVASGEYGQQLNKLVTLTENGKLSYPFVKEAEIADSFISEENKLCLETIPEYYSSTLSQLRVLLYRMFLQSIRNPMQIKLKCLMYSIMIILLTSTYYKCGNDATQIFPNINFLFVSLMGTMYCSLMPPLVHFPLEIKLIQSEYFNRWYNIPAYFLAKSLAVIPGFVIFISLYVGVIYPLTDQPFAADKIIKFIAICVLINMIADGYSMAIASVFSVRNSFFLGLLLMSIPILLTVMHYGLPFDKEPLIFQLMIRTSFLRYALEGLLEVVYTDRPERLNCPETEIMCPVTSPKDIPKMFGYGTMEYWTCFSALIGFYVITKCAHYFLLKQRLRPGKPAEMALYLAKFGKRLLVNKYLP